MPVTLACSACNILGDLSGWNWVYTVADLWKGTLGHVNSHFEGRH